MKILILGSRGMLGSELSSAFREKEKELVMWDRNEIDISSKSEVMEKVVNLKPDIIVNAAAYTAVDEAESHRDLAEKVNGYAVGYLAEASKKINALLIHFSTDYVFCGENSRGYDENYLVTKPLNVYGESKALGEKLIVEVSLKYYLIRTSWLFGRGGKNFIETMLRLAKEGKEIKVVDDQVGSPTYVKDLAAEVVKLSESKRPFGIYHITNSGTCSWYEFAEEIFKLSNLKPEISPVSSEKFPTPAKRPHYSILLNTKLPFLRSWKEALKDYLVETGRIV